MKKYFLIIFLFGKMQCGGLETIFEKKNEYENERRLVTQILECQQALSLLKEEPPVDRKALFRRSSMVSTAEIAQVKLLKKIKKILDEPKKPPFIELLEEYYKAGVYDVPTGVLAFIYTYFPESSYNKHINTLLEKYGSYSAFHQKLLKIQKKFIENCDRINAQPDELKSEKCVDHLQIFYEYLKKIELLEKEYPAEEKKKNIHLFYLKNMVSKNIQNFLVFINDNLYYKNTPIFFSHLIEQFENSNDKKEKEEIIENIQNVHFFLTIHIPGFLGTPQGRRFNEILLGYEKNEKKKDSLISG